MLPTDERSSWDAGLLDDTRVVSLWDGELAVSRWVARPPELGLDSFGPVVYDVYLLFAPGARWEAKPSGLVAAGLPVIGESSKLASAVDRLLGQSS